MSKVTVTPGGSGEGLVGFKKLWEGDVAGSSEDITGGTVDLTKYHAVLVHYSGTLTNPYDSKGYYGLIEVRESSNPTYDGYVSKNSSEAVDVTLFATKVNGSWLALRSQIGTILVKGNPLKFLAGGCNQNGLHFTVYGMQL